MKEEDNSMYGVGVRGDRYVWDVVGSDTRDGRRFRNKVCKEKKQVGVAL